MHLNGKLCFTTIRETTTICRKQERMMRHVRTKNVHPRSTSNYLTGQLYSGTKEGFPQPHLSKHQQRPPGSNAGPQTLSSATVKPTGRPFPAIHGVEPIRKEGSPSSQTATWVFNNHRWPVHHPQPILPFWVRSPDSGSHLQSSQ